MTQPDNNLITLRIGHSPDPDDAFMWFPLIPGPEGKALIDTSRFRFQHILEDIQSLNVRCEKAELEITALSIHQYPFVADKYALTSCGSSMGDGYGPMIVTRDSSMTPDDLRKLPAPGIAVPGTRTTAFLALSLLLGKGSFQYHVLPFDQILQSVSEGRAAAGLIIHEGQLTYQNLGLHLTIDLGKWWSQQYQLPLPLGGNAIRRDLGQPMMREVCSILLKSIDFALNHRQAALQHALSYARDMDASLADKFVGMYVNHWTLDYGQRGRQAVRTLLQQGHQAGLVPDAGDIDFVEPA